MTVVWLWSTYQRKSIYGLFHLIQWTTTTMCRVSRVYVCVCVCDDVQCTWGLSDVCDYTICSSQVITQVLSAHRTDLFGHSDVFCSRVTTWILCHCNCTQQPPAPRIVQSYSLTNNNNNNNAMYLQLFMHHAHAHAALTAIHIVQMYTKHTHRPRVLHQFQIRLKSRTKCTLKMLFRSFRNNFQLNSEHTCSLHTHTRHFMQGTGHRMNYNEEDDEEGTCACAMLLLHRKGETQTRHDTHTQTNAFCIMNLNDKYTTIQNIISRFLKVSIKHPNNCSECRNARDALCECGYGHLPVPEHSLNKFIRLVSVRL